MAANDEFPRGWTSTVIVVGGASIVIPAAPGVAHVLDGFTFILDNTSGGATTNVTLSLSSSDGAYNSLPIGRAVADAASAGSDSDTDLNLAAGPGASLTISAPAVAVQHLRVHGHDI